MGGTNLVNVNYANVANQIKINDTLKYYQASLGDLSSTADETEKSRIKKSAQSFLLKQRYFSTVWPTLIKQDQDKILDMIAEGKGVMPYEKITDIYSLKITPADGSFFTHTEFYSSLKQSNVSINE